MTTLYAVQPSRDEWIVVRQGSERPAERFPRKREAVDSAVRLARRNRPARLRIWRTDLTIQDEREYPEEG